VSSPSRCAKPMAACRSDHTGRRRLVEKRSGCSESLPLDVFTLRNDADGDRPLQRQCSNRLIELVRRINSMACDPPDSIPRTNAEWLKGTANWNRLDYHAAPTREIIDAVDRAGYPWQYQDANKDKRWASRDNCARQIEEKNDPTGQ